MEAMALKQAQHLNRLGRTPGGCVVKPGMAWRRRGEGREEREVAGRGIKGALPAPGLRDQRPDRTLIETRQLDQIPRPEDAPAFQPPEIGKDRRGGGLDQQAIAALAGK